MRSSKGAKREACSHCGQPLIELPWRKTELGQRTYILTCDNLGCACYRSPVKPTTREAGGFKL